MKLWSRVGVRTASVALLVVGLIGGIHLGQQQFTAQPDRQQAEIVYRADAEENRLLRLRQNEHAAARAWQREAEGAAAAKAAVEVKSAAGKSRELNKKIADRAAAEKKAKDEANAPDVPFAGPIPDSCNEFSGNRKTGCALMLAKGFGIEEFPCLNKLWNKESGWNARAENRGSGAYGIPQALPGSKMKSEGADWKTNPATQIKWGLGYIKGRYKTPCGAWNNFLDNGNY